MMVHTTGGRRGGNLELDRQVTELGATRQERRIRVSIGSDDPKKLARANEIVDKLIETEEFDLLRAMRDGKVSVPAVIAADRHGRAHLTLGRVKQRAPIWDRIIAVREGVERTEPGAFSAFLARVPGARTRRRYQGSLSALQRKAGTMLNADATVADLLTVDWGALYDAWEAGNADWMHLRRALSRFATLHFGDKWDPTARQLRTLIPSKRVKKRRPTLSIEQFLRITETVPLHAAAALWVLVITGVRVGEYLASTKAHLDASSRTYDVPGTKTEGSAAPVRVDARWWIYLERGIPARIGYKWLSIYWARGCVATGVARRVGTGVFVTVQAPRPSRRPRADEKAVMVRVEKTRYVGPTLHDLRHCHGQWAINAGVAESKVQGSLRHESADQTRDYVMQSGTLDVSSALADAMLVAAPEPKKPRRKKA